MQRGHSSKLEKMENEDYLNGQSKESVRKKTTGPIPMD